MHTQGSGNILEAVKLSHKEILELARELSLSQKVNIKKFDGFGFADIKRSIHNAFFEANHLKCAGESLPAISEWFYDNRALFFEQIRQMELNKTSQSLPHLRTGNYKGMPRCYALAAELCTHSSFYLTADSIYDFLVEYQKETGLNSAELFLFTDMLKVILLRAAYALSVRSIKRIKLWEKADEFYHSIEEEKCLSPTTLKEYRSLIVKPIFLERALELVKTGPHAPGVISSINNWLSKFDLSTERLIHKAHVTRTKDLAYIANAVSSLRMLSKLSFKDMFEKVSIVHKTLCQDSVYPKMDYETRDFYRRCVAKIALSMRVSETAVAKEAVKLSENEQIHVGRYLTGDKKQQLMNFFGELPRKEKLNLFFKKHALFFYIGGNVVSTIVSALLLSWSIFRFYPIGYGILGFVLSLIPIYTAVVAFNNRIFTLLNKPSFIPKMEYKNGIPQECATMVVIPALVTSEKTGLELIENMRVFYAANQQDNIYFTLLSDFKSNKNEVAPQDEHIISQLEKAVKMLNEKCGDIFFYAQRKRSFNVQTKKYEGWERKRGALLNFCELLSGDGSAFMHVTKNIPQNIKYVITLDADTQLGRDAAVRLVGAMSHPLAAPVVDEKTGVVVSGHGIMQPRIGVDVVSAVKTRFSFIYSGSAGLDTYACAASDLYQDTFGTGIFTGKGIFDLNVYSRVLKNTFPENTVLSHDLLEGSYLRCALVTDITFMDSYPSTYLSYASRQHRWVRGDWQLLPWLTRRVRTRNEQKRNPLSSLAKYQIFDNIRRSLVQPLCFIVILLSQTAFYRSAFFWFISGVMPLFIDSVLDFVTQIIKMAKNAGKGVTFKDAWMETRSMFERAFYSFAFLAYETYLMLDAAVRTITRVAITKKNLLQWVTAADSDARQKNKVTYYWVKMMYAPILATLLYALSILITAKFSPVAFCLYLLWFFAPTIAYAISRRKRSRKTKLGELQQQHLADTALKTWRFFEEYSALSPYMWTPDNVQISPKRGAALRTSPTNVSFSLLSFVIAYYMGFCSLWKSVNYIEQCFIGIERANKWNGHLYNWYDIKTLEPLCPKYISSVDSGNLACYLIVVEQALKNMIKVPIASYIKKGLTVVAREQGKALELSRGEDVFSAIGVLYSIDDKKGRLKDLKLEFEKHINTYASWAHVLQKFPPESSDYTRLVELLCDKMSKITISEFVIVFDEILDLHSKIVMHAEECKHEKVIKWALEFEAALSDSLANAKRMCQRVAGLRRRIEQVFANMEFNVLYDDEKGLFSIGLVEGEELSQSHYDLFASEARQAGFIAIAKKDVPSKHWFRLSRPLTVAGDQRVLLSWGGTMFEYLMPLIIMKDYEHTLLSETYKTVIQMQSDYARKVHVPWGVSESGYYAFDLQMNYQYKAFGIPVLGMKSGLSREIVVSPYSTALALQVNPKLAYLNLLRLEKLGVSGKYGFYEAVDYTPSRLKRGKRKRIVKSYMAHHQGMILGSIFNCLNNDKIQELFHSSTIVKATQELLKEKVPPRSVTMNLGEKVVEQTVKPEPPEPVQVYTKQGQYPQAHFLSNGSYTVMMTQYGAGYSSAKGVLLGRWSGDVIRNACGLHIYIKNNDTDAVWSATVLPTCVRADNDRAVFELDKASFYRTVGDIETTLEVCVSPEFDMEVRQLSIKNNSDDLANLSVCCAVSPALSTKAEFAAHPAFCELFVETEVEGNTVYARRRGKDRVGALKACSDGDCEIFNDRTKVFGRQRVFGPPMLLTEEKTEHDVARAMCINCGVTVGTGEQKSISFAAGVADSKDKLEKSLGTISSQEDVKRVFHLAHTHAQVEKKYLQLKNVPLLQKIASRTVIKVPTSYSQEVKSGEIGTLWKLGISGDFPIILMFADKGTETITILEKAQEFMVRRGLRADMVVVYEGAEQYICPVRDRLCELEQAGCIKAFPKAFTSQEDIAVVANAACLVIDGEKPLAEQLEVDMLLRTYEIFGKARKRQHVRYPKSIKTFDNTKGGFVSNMSEYCIDSPERPPYAWSNLLVNKSFGCLISAGGGGYTYAENCRMNRLTPFRNDALTDICPEGVLIRDERDGSVFSTMPDALRKGKYRIIHGFGYTIFERFGEISTKLHISVDKELPVKTLKLEISNNSEEDLGLSVYYFAELDDSKSGGYYSQMNEGMLSAKHLLSGTDKSMFISMPGWETSYTASMYEFFGVPGNVIIPEATKVKELSNSCGYGAGILALQTRVNIPVGETVSIPMIMGYGNEQAKADILESCGAIEKLRHSQQKTSQHWRSLVGCIKVSTPFKSFDALVNGWLTYQTYASRLWGRTGYYQSGGAFGFRDQLQDVMSLVYTDPGATRNQIIKCALHQFIEGDVLHWWHEPNRGVRTKISDDKLFLPYVASQYAKITGDYEIFDEDISYLEGEPIPEGKNDLYKEFVLSEMSENLFMHCKRAIDSSLALGEHGLPLMGTGDWNDGMDKVGEDGTGESVWLAFFLIEVLRLFIDLCERRSENKLVEEYRKIREELRENTEMHAWDGSWYMRAYFDDGTPLGSSSSTECRIDLISQAWAVISGAQHGKTAFRSAEERLVMREEGVIRLLEPSFDIWDKDPGYIKDYLPGVRENGGQYTHAASWYIIAAAQLGLKNEALELFEMINPINHTRTAQGVEKYKGEPYVIAADVYYNHDHKGRAGWTWYTGSAGWMYQAAVFHLLGMKIEDGELSIVPCLPDDFGRYSIEYQRNGAYYTINVELSPGYEGAAWLEYEGERSKSVKLDKANGTHIINACWQMP